MGFGILSTSQCVTPPPDLSIPAVDAQQDRSPPHPDGDYQKSWWLRLAVGPVWPWYLEPISPLP